MIASSFAKNYADSLDPPLPQTQHALADAGKEQKVVIVATKSTLT